MSEIKGIYMGDRDFANLSSSTFSILEKKGFTHIYYTLWADKTPTTDYNTCVERINKIKEYTESTNLQLYADFPALISPTDTSTNPWHYIYIAPSDLNFLDLMSLKCGELVSDCDINGVCFDDYTYPTSLHVSENNAQEQVELVSFATTCKETINEAGGKLGLAIGYSDSPSLFADRMKIYEDSCDYVMPEIYVHTSQPSTSWVHQCVKAMETAFTNSNNTLLPIVISYDLITKDIFSQYRMRLQSNSVLSFGVAGVVLFSYRYLDPYFSFDNRKIVSRSYHYGFRY